MQKIFINFIILAFLLMLGGCGRGSAVYVATGSDAAIQDKNQQELMVEQDYSSETEGELVDEEGIPVYVCGAVVNPGVYYLPLGSIKQDALYMAGGFLEGASIDYVNLAEEISSGERIYFPYESELGEEYSPIDGSGYPSSEGDNSSGKVNINTATADILMTLPGIGASKAQAIINYREDVGLFYHIEDIKNVSGIKDNIYDNIKDIIVVN